MPRSCCGVAQDALAVMPIVGTRLFDEMTGRGRRPWRNRCHAQHITKHDERSGVTTVSTPDAELDPAVVRVSAPCGQRWTARGRAPRGEAPPHTDIGDRPAKPIHSLSKR